jgi:hypothetical protein
MKQLIKAAATCAVATLPLLAYASSHREAPFIGTLPQVDGTDLYAFRSYEAGRDGYVTLIANYLPFQDPPGGPNFYKLDSSALYEIHVDNDGDSLPDVEFRFRFSSVNKDLAVNAGGKSVPVPLINTGPVDKNGANLNVTESYTLDVVQGGKNNGTVSSVANATLGGNTFYKPVDNIGKKSIPDYPGYAGNFIYEVTIPGCNAPGRVFAGQRKEGFVVNVGEIFDLVNTNPVGPRDAEPNDLSHKNITSLALEVPISCLTKGSDPVIGVWTTASVRQVRILNADPSSASKVAINGGALTQVSRLGNPLVNEVVIGLPDKDRFNNSRPFADAQFLTYVSNPSLPVLLNSLFGDAAKIPETPRNDLVATFLTGVKGLNQPVKVTPAELLRLNTSIVPTPPASQNDLGVLGGDNAGFPNGRRPYDDVTDIEIRALEGALCGTAGDCGTQKSDPNGGAPYTDGARAAGADASSVHVSGAINPADTYLDVFPYLSAPLPGSPNGGG